MKKIKTKIKGLIKPINQAKLLLQFTVIIITISILTIGTVQFVKTSKNVVVAEYDNVMKDFDYSTATLTIPKARAEEELSMREWIKREVENAGLSWGKIDCLIQNESGWNNWAYNLNTNGTTDFGIFQINSIHKNTISVEDRWNYKKATKWAINKRLRDGNYNAWYGYINNCN